MSGVVSLTVPKWIASIAWFTCFKGAVRIQIINECVGLVFKCTADDVRDGKCIAQTGEQM